MSNLKESATSRATLFDSAYRYVLAAHVLVTGSLANEAGSAIADRPGALLSPIKLLLDSARSHFEKLERAIAAGASADSLERMRNEAVLVLLAAMAVAETGDEIKSDDVDCQDSGYLIFPLRLLLETANDRFSHFELALMEANK